MYAIISEFDPDSITTIRSFWQRLCRLCGLKEIYHLPIPHFTWMLAEEMEIPLVRAVIDRIAAENEPLTVRTFGLGIFTGEEPVLYLPIVKSLPLLHLHQEIWEEAQPLSTEVHQYYSPPFWIPHITLALKDLTQERLNCAISEIAFKPIELSCRALQLALVKYVDGRRGETLHTAAFNSGQEQP
jgi:2'-5' RNA ligase